MNHIKKNELIAFIFFFYEIYANKIPFFAFIFVIILLIRIKKINNHIEYHQRKKDTINDIVSTEEKRLHYRK
jgi:hypothetical protein